MIIFLCLIANFSCIHKKKKTATYQCNFCLSHGTLVRLANGKDILIENLKSGDTVLAFNKTTELFVPSRVIKTLQTEHDGFVKMNFGDLFRNGVEVFKKTSIIISKDHPIWVKGKAWCSSEPEMTKRIQMMKEVRKIEVGDFCYTNMDLSMEGFAGVAKLISVENVKGPVRAYTIVELENKLDCFIANGIVVGTEAMSMENGGD